MRDYDRIINESIRKVLNEEELKSGQTFRLPFAGPKGMKILSQKYGVPPTDFYYDQANNYFVYKPKKRPKQKKFKGKPEGMSDEEYLEIIRQVNPKFATKEGEIEGEEWRPVPNPGLYFGGEADFSKRYEVSDHGRIRVINFADPMRSRISNGYYTPQKSSMAFTMHSKLDNGQKLRTTPNLHNMVAAAFLDPPEGDLSQYVVRHKDGDWTNNHKDNLEYVKKDFLKSSSINNKEIGESMKRTIRLTENDLHKVIKESVKRVLREWQFDNDLDYQRIADEAYEYLEKNEPTEYDWRDIAEGMGYRMESIGPNDMETLKDAIEDAMHDFYVYQEEMDNRNADYGESIH